MKLLTCIFCFALCPAILLSQNEPLYLNPDNAPGAKASVIFAGADLIPLETSKASYFTNMKEFIVTPHHFVFLDDASNTVFIFNKQGKFLYKYKKKKYKIESIQYLYSQNALFIKSANKNYTIPKVKAQQMIAMPGKRDFSKYINLELLHLDDAARYTIQSLPVPRYAMDRLYYYNGDYLSVNDRYNKYLKDTVAYHLNIVRDNKVIRSYFPFLNIPKLSSYYADVSFVINNTIEDACVLVQKELDHTIYKLTPDSLHEAYKFVFTAAHTMPADFYSTLFKNNIDYRTVINKNNKVIFAFHNMMQYKDFVFFTAITLASRRNYLVFNSADKKLYDLGKFTTDSAVYFLPSRVFTSITERDNEYVYTKVSAADLLREKNKIQSKNEVLPGYIKELLGKLDKFDNPIIIRLKLQPSTGQK